MKKLATAFAACMLAGLVSAQVESQNIVGYQTFEGLVSGGVYLIGDQFALVGGGSTVVPIASLTNGTLKAGSNVSSGDNLQTWDPSIKAYVTYFYRTGYGWVNSTNNTVVTTDTVDLRNGVFLRKKLTAGSLTFSGEVYGRTSVTNDNLVSGGVYLFANPWPVDVPVASLTNGTLKAGSNVSSGDNLQTWDSSAKAYVTYFYRTGYGWVNSTNNTVVTSDVIPAGQAFFFRKKLSAGSLILNRSF